MHVSRLPDGRLSRVYKIPRCPPYPFMGVALRALGADLALVTITVAVAFSGPALEA
jgi:hypothetical protein